MTAAVAAALAVVMVSMRMKERSPKVRLSFGRETCNLDLPRAISLFDRDGRRWYPPLSPCIYAPWTMRSRSP